MERVGVRSGSSSISVRYREKSSRSPTATSSTWRPRFRSSSRKTFTRIVFSQRPPAACPSGSRTPGTPAATPLAPGPPHHLAPAGAPGSRAPGAPGGRAPGRPPSSDPGGDPIHLRSTRHALAFQGIDARRDELIASASDRQWSRESRRPSPVEEVIGHGDHHGRGLRSATVERDLRWGSWLMGIAAVGFIGYAVIFFIRNFTDAFLELGIGPAQVDVGRDAIRDFSPYLYHTSGTCTSRSRGSSRRRAWRSCFSWPTASARRAWALWARRGRSWVLLVALPDRSRTTSTRSATSG